MSWLDAVRLACSALRGGLMRTLLTILGLGVGVGAVLTVLTLGDAGEERVETEIARLGVDKVWLRARDAAHQLMTEDSAALRQAAQAPACAGAYTVALVQAEGASSLTQIAGYDNGMSAVHAVKLLAGRSFTPDEYAQGSTVCLIDKAMAERMSGDAVGKRITIGNRRMRIVGVVKGMTMQAMAAGSGLVILPLNTYLDTFGGQIAEITLSVQRGQNAQTVADQALQLLSAQGFRADTLENEIAAAREVVRIFVTVLVCVAIVCMITGGIGVMNVLLVSVRERRKEIGLIKAIGGTSGQVGALFLLEAAAYALLGGFLGIVLGMGMTALFAAWIGLDATLQLEDVVPVLLGATVLGCLFGVLPAIRAAALQPVDALRAE